MVELFDSLWNSRKEIRGEDSSAPAKTCKIPDDLSYLEFENLPNANDRECGLVDFLDKSRDIAAEAVGNFFTEIGIDKNNYRYLKDIPIGLEEEKDYTSYPVGLFGILVGRDSDEIEGFYTGDKERNQKYLAMSFAHEMIHVIQTVPSSINEDGMVTIGNKLVGWGGIEEGMAEALGRMAMSMHYKGFNREEAANDLEKRCRENNVMPATRMSARLIGKMSDESLAEYLTIAQTGNYSNNNNILRKVLGEEYGDFLKKMELLYYEFEEKDRVPNQSLIHECETIIDNAGMREREREEITHSAA